MRNFLEFEKSALGVSEAGSRLTDAIAENLKQNAERMSDMAAAENLAELCPVRGAEANDYLNRIIMAGNGSLMASLGFEELDSRRCFVKVEHRDFALLSAEDFFSVETALRAAYAKFSPSSYRILLYSGEMPVASVPLEVRREYWALCAEEACDAADQSGSGLEVVESSELDLPETVVTELKKELGRNFFDQAASLGLLYRAGREGALAGAIAAAPAREGPAGGLYICASGFREYQSLFLQALGEMLLRSGGSAANGLLLMRASEGAASLASGAGFESVLREARGKL